MSEVLKIDNVSKVYQADGGNVLALDGVSLSIEEGSFLSVVGHSGSGKSTLLNLLGLVDTPSSGSISIYGQVINRLTDQQSSKYRNQHIGFVFQKFNLFVQRTALENVLVPCRIGGMSNRVAHHRAVGLLERFGIQGRANHFIGELSGGERQRVAIARALVMRPSLILADEPTGNLDEDNANMVFETLHDVSKTGTSVVMVTHDRRLAAKASKSVELQSGRIAN